MNKKNLVVYALFFSALQPAWALSEGDFFCKETAPVLPSFFAGETRSCPGSDGSTAGKTNEVCVVQAYCRVVDNTLKNSQIVNSAGATVLFTQLTEKEKAKYFSNVNAGWLQSTLICEKKDPGPICPSPEHCKGDLLYGRPAPAQLSAADFGEITGREQQGINRVFNHKSGNATQ